MPRESAEKESVAVNGLTNAGKMERGLMMSGCEQDSGGRGWGEGERDKNNSPCISCGTIIMMLHIESKDQYTMSEIIGPK